ncbi:MAG: NAD(P)H-binding protein [Arenicella sp.]
MNKHHHIHINQTVLVIGGRGFIGRHIVQQLKRLGANVVIGTRNIQHVKGSHDPIRQICLHKIHDIQGWSERLNGIDVVVNAVGILRQRHQETYEQVHHHAVALLAEACTKHNIRLIHISALGLGNPIKSRFSQSKRRGELALISSKANWALVRPSLVDGENGYGAKWFRKVAKWPIYALPVNAKGVFTPIDVDDLGEAVARIALLTATEKEENRIYELGGKQRVTLTAYLTLLRPNTMDHRALTVKVPKLLARFMSHLCDVFNVTPYSFGHYELLQHDNYPCVNRLSEILGRDATPLGVEQETVLVEPVISKA